MTPTSTAVVWADPQREAAFGAWLAPLATQHGLRTETLRPASADASFRRYLRIDAQAGNSLIVMDAPPAQENCEPFVRIAGLMREAGLRVPQILAWDEPQGFMLLDDLGHQTLLDVILPEQPAANLPAYLAATESLLAWQTASRPGVLPAYDEALLRRELQLFPEWYVQRHLGVEFSEQQQALWQRASQLLIDSALAQPKVLVHRDYMPRNLMLSEPNPGVLDFQDAVYGPVTYDVTCLFKDAFLSWPEARVRSWLEQYWQQAREAGVPVQPVLDDFLRASDLMGVQRHLKVIGIFARICHRDGKPKYLGDVPRFFSYIEAVLARRPELAELAELLGSLRREPV